MSQMVELNTKEDAQKLLQKEAVKFGLNFTGAVVALGAGLVLGKAAVIAVGAHAIGAAFVCTAGAVSSGICGYERAVSASQHGHNVILLREAGKAFDKLDEVAKQAAEVAK